MCCLLGPLYPLPSMLPAHRLWLLPLSQHPLSGQMASMKMFQIQFHTGFVPRNATTVKFAKYGVGTGPAGQVQSVASQGPRSCVTAHLPAPARGVGTICVQRRAGGPAAQAGSWVGSSSWVGTNCCSPRTLCLSPSGKGASQFAWGPYTSVLTCSYTGAVPNPMRLWRGSRLNPADEAEG